MVNVKDDYLLKCPLCNKKLWYSSANSHRKAKHRNTSAKQFEKLLIESIQSGRIIPKHYSDSNIPGNKINSGTQKLVKEKRTNKLGIRSLVRGGKVSPN